MGEILPRRYLLATGWTSNEISRAVTDGGLIRLATGMYAHAGDYSPWQLYRMRVEAEARICSSVVSHESAAALHEIPFLNPTRGRVHMTVDRAHGGGRRAAVHPHPRPLQPDEVAVVGGCRVTSRARTAIDVAMTGHLIRAVAALDAVRLVRRYPGPEDPAPVTLTELTTVLDRLGRRRGSAVAKQALALSVDRSESAGESWSRMLMLTWGLPAPRLQTRFQLDGREYFADFEWGSLVGEFDGRGKYGDVADPAHRADALDAEKSRQAAFARHGFEVVRWGWADLRDEARLRGLLAAAIARHRVTRAA